MAKKKRPEEVTESFPCFFINVHSEEAPHILTAAMKKCNLSDVWDFAYKLVDLSKSIGGNPYMLRIIDENQDEVMDGLVRLDVFRSNKKTVPEPVKKSKPVTKQGRLF